MSDFCVVRIARAASCFSISDVFCASSALARASLAFSAAASASCAAFSTISSSARFKKLMNPLFNDGFFVRSFVDIAYRSSVGVRGRESF